MPGRISGKVMRQNVFHAFAPRSAAASSSRRSKFFRLVRTTTTTNEMLNAMCAMITVVRLRRNICPVMRWKSSKAKAEKASKATAITISGITIGR